MSESIQFIELEDNEDSLKMLKMMISAMMKEWQNQLINIDLPKREEYSSDEEFDKEYKKYLIETIDDIKDVKGNIFKNVNQIYSNFLKLKNDSIESFRKEKIEREQIIKGVKKDIKVACITVAGLSLIVPGSLPFLLIINVPRVGIGIYVMKKNKDRIELNMGVEKRLEELENPLFELTWSLRDDYNKSKEELDNLKLQVLEGKDVLENLIAMFNPKRVQLQELTEEEFNSMPFEEPKQLKKDIDN